MSFLPVGSHSGNVQLYSSLLQNKAEFPEFKLCIARRASNSLGVIHTG